MKYLTFILLFCSACFITTCNNKPVISHRHSGDVPDNNIEAGKAKLKLHDTILKSPVSMDSRTGLVYTIPENLLNSNHAVNEFTIPVYDSPIMICDKKFLKDRNKIQTVISIL